MFSAELWLGDIPNEHASLKKLRQVMFAVNQLTPGIPQPWVKVLPNPTCPYSIQCMLLERPKINFSLEPEICAKEL